MYENPKEFLDEDEEQDKRRRKWAIHRALEMAEKNKTKKESAEVDKDDILEAAEEFNEFVEGNK